MVRNGGLKSGRLLDLIDDFNAITQDDVIPLGTDAVQLRFQRTVNLYDKIRNLWIIISEDIHRKKMELARQHHRVKYCSVGQSSDWRSYEIEALERTIDERYYKHHGRATEKHRLVREPEEQIRILRRTVVHRGESLAAEKKLINDIKNVEETRAKIIANGLEHMQYSFWKFNSIEDIENQIKVWRAELTERRYAKTLVDAKNNWSDKHLRIMEKELKKVNEMHDEIFTLLQSSYK